MRQEQLKQQNITGVSGASPGIANFVSAFNAVNGIVNAIRTTQDNNRLRESQKNYGERLTEALKDIMPYLNNNQQAVNQTPTISVGEVPQTLGQGGYTLGNNPITVGDVPQQKGFSSVFGQSEDNPFGVSVSGEGQRITDNGSVSPAQNVLPSLSNTQPQVQQLQPQQQTNGNSYQNILDGRLSVQNFLKAALDKGINPVDAMTIFGGIISPMEEAARTQRIRDNFAALAKRDDGLSAEDLLKIRAQLSYDLGKDYKLEDLNNLTDLLSKQQSGLLSPAGLMHGRETLKKVGIDVDPSVWAGLGNGGGGNYGGNSGNGFGDSEYGGDNENARTIYTYLKNKGFADNVIAGIMGNLQAESQFNPSIDYGDGGTSGGIAQWHDEQPGVGRLSNLKNFAVNRQMNWKDLGTQLDFLMEEINKNHPDLIQRMSKLTPNEAAILFHDEFERSRDNQEQKARRGKYADEIYNGRKSAGRDWSQSLEGKSWVRNNDGVDLSNAQSQTLSGLNQISDVFQKMTGKPLIVTSGNDGNVHAGGQFSHGNGWKIDVSGNGLENPETRNAFIKQCEGLGIKVLDEYANPSQNSTGGHLDLDFSGYRGGTGQPMVSRQSFSIFKQPQIQGSGNVMLNPLVAYKMAMEQQERQRIQGNADRNYALQVAQFNELKRHNAAREDIRSGRGAGTKGANGNKAMSPQEYSRTILEYSNTPEVDDEGNSAISQDLVDKVGRAYAPELLQYIQKSNGNIEEAVKNFYRDKHANGQKGYSLSHNKLVAAIGSAYTYLEDSGNNSNVLQNTSKIKDILDQYATGKNSTGENVGDISDTPVELEPESPQTALEERRQKNREIDERVKEIEPKIIEMNRLFKFSGYDTFSAYDTYLGNKNFLNQKNKRINEIKKQVGLTDEEIDFYYKNRKNAWDRALDEENTKINQGDRISLPWGRYTDNQRD